MVCATVTLWCRRTGARALHLRVRTAPCVQVFFIVQLAAEKMVKSCTSFVYIFVGTITKKST